MHTSMKDHQPTETRGATSEVSGRYKVLGLLGHGSFGTVAAGLNRETGKKLAITRIHPIAGSISGARHILKEITTMRVLQHHPNVRQQPTGDRQTNTLPKKYGF